MTMFPIFGPLDEGAGRCCLSGPALSSSGAPSVDESGNSPVPVGFSLTTDDDPLHLSGCNGNILDFDTAGGATLWLSLSGDAA